MSETPEVTTARAAYLAALGRGATVMSETPEVTAARAVYLAAEEASTKASAAFRDAQIELARALGAAAGVSVGALVEHQEYRVGETIWAVYRVSEIRLGYGRSDIRLRGERRLKDGSFGAVPSDLHRRWRLVPTEGSAP